MVFQINLHSYTKHIYNFYHSSPSLNYDIKLLFFWHFLIRKLENNICFFYFYSLTSTMKTFSGHFKEKLNTSKVKKKKYIFFTFQPLPKCNACWVQSSMPIPRCFQNCLNLKRFHCRFVQVGADQKEECQPQLVTILGNLHQMKKSQ